MGEMKFIRADGEVLANMFMTGRRDVEIFDGLPAGYELFRVEKTNHSPRTWKLYFVPLRPYDGEDADEINPSMVRYFKENE